MFEAFAPPTTNTEAEKPEMRYVLKHLASVHWDKEMGPLCSAKEVARKPTKGTRSGYAKSGPPIRHGGRFLFVLFIDVPVPISNNVLGHLASCSHIDFFFIFLNIYERPS